jgi:hypothetical protein
MKTSKVLNISGNRFALPEGMSAKDIQALVGFLAMFRSVGSEYDYLTSNYLHFVSNCVSVQLEDMELGNKAEVQAAAAKAYEEYKAKKAEKETA